MSEVWKVTLEGARDSMNLPDGAAPLRAGVQHGDIVVWFEVDPAAALDPSGRVLLAVNTGMELPERRTYIDTVTSENGIVWHVYEVDPRVSP